MSDPYVPILVRESHAKRVESYAREIEAAEDVSLSDDGDDRDRLRS